MPSSSSSLVLVLFVPFIVFSFFEPAACYVCTADYCTTHPCSVDSQCLASSTSKVIKKGGRCGCCDLCIYQKALNDECTPTKTDGSLPDAQCGPQLTCDKNTKRCVYRTESPCVCEQLDYDNMRKSGYLVPGKLRPTCDDLGNYQSVQCITGAVCFCVNDVGDRLFGADFQQRETSINCDCSRNADSLRTVLKTAGVMSYGSSDFSKDPPFSHCLPNGNYDPLQCVGDNCFCLTKDLKLQGKISSASIKETLVCYNPNYHGESYARPCETVRDYILRKLDNATLFNSEILGVDLPACDLDGSYAPVQCANTTCYCAYKNGSRISGYEAERYSEAAAQMNCYCVRDRMYVTDPTFKEQLRCQANGNYEPLQCQGSLCFCVDQKGIQRGPEVRRSEAYKLSCRNGLQPLNCPAV